MTIRPIQLSKIGILSRSIQQNITPLRYTIKKGSFDSFSQNSKLENKIAKLQLKLQEHKRMYNSLSRKLDFSFGEDWIFCYPDLNDKQSDMYIECIAQKSMATLCEKKIAKLTQKISSQAG